MINLAIKDISHSLGKFIVTSIGVGMLLGIVLVMLGVYRGMIVDAKSLINNVNADLWIVQEDTIGPFAESSKLFEDVKYQIKGIYGVKNVAGITFQTLQIQTNNRLERVTAVGYEIGKLGRPNNILYGREIIKSHYEIVVDEKLGIVLDTMIPLGRNIYKVVGITKGAVSNSGEPLVYLSLQDAQELQFSSSNNTIRNDRIRGIGTSNNPTVNAIIATVTPNVDLNEISQNIKRWKHKNCFTNDEQAIILTKNVLEKSSKQIGMFTIILIIVSSVIISLIIYTMTIGKIKEIAILKLIGMPNFEIIKMILQQSLILGFLAFIAGNIFANLISDKFPKNVVLLWTDSAGLFIVIIIVSVIGSLFGIYKAINANPAQAIGE
ncbi:MAG: ABC transporter permease [Arcobacteraceae bacterium]|nr:ABC transporter permease [Arcobacteraceae bacterium]